MALQHQLTGALPGGEQQAEAQIFNYGPGSGPWQNAVMALRAGLVLALPFQFLSLLQFQEDRGDPYVHFQWAATILFSLSFWAILSFLFGYFFHVLRGRDGLQKGLVFFLTIVAPTIPQRLLGQQPVFKGAHLVQMFEIFAFLLILGLFVFDLRSLQRFGFRWKDLVSAHGLTTITGYATSVVITTLASLAGPTLKSAVSILLGKIGLGSGS